MKNITLLLVLIAGLLAGYFVGDYRGKAAREALEKAVETGKTLDSERETAISELRTELEGINEKHQREIAAVRKINDSKVSGWRRTKDGLDDTIKRTTTELIATDSKLKSLVSQHDDASGAEKTRLGLEIERLRKEQNILRKEIEGNTCLQAQVPHGVFEALNETKIAGIKQ
ncbi:MAG: hypothetical protein WAW02_15735 [Sideroxyarcus sp.]